MSETSFPSSPSLIDGQKALESSTNDLPTPPSTEDDEIESARILAVVQDIKLRKAGRSPASTTETWKRFPLSQTEYNQLLQVLQNDASLWAYIEDKIRYDYFPSIQRFVLRMTTFLHDNFILSVAEDIKHQLKCIGIGQSPSADFARSIRHSTSTIKPLDPACGPHCPDSFFIHDGAQFPGVVLEVSYSQKRKDLHRLADDYILGSDHNIRVVVGLDVDYNSKEAILSMWRPGVERGHNGNTVFTAKQVITNQVFRNKQGHPVRDSDSGLYLSLEDFTNSQVLSQYLPASIQGEIHITAAALCTYLSTAEEQWILQKENRGLVTTLPAGTKRWREETPPEEILSADERRFQDDEPRARKRVETLDSSFEPSSSISSGDGETVEAT